jgi:hypothetical protein
MANPSPEPMRVISLGGGPGNDAVGAIAFLMERNVSCGIAPSVVLVPSEVLPRPTKLTWAEKKAAKKAGVDIKAQAAPVGPYSDFAGAVPRRGTVVMPTSARFPACPSVHCHVLDLDDEWYSSVGASVQRSTDQYFGCGGHAVPPAFAAMHWHECDVTQPLRGWHTSLPPGLERGREPQTRGGQVEGSAALALVPNAAIDAGGAALVFASYLFTDYTQGGATPVCAAFWTGLLAENPGAWVIFVEGCVSKRTWLRLQATFASAGRALAAPANIVGELPQRVVVPSERRPHPIRERPRSYCYWFSPPPASPA